MRVPGIPDYVLEHNKPPEELLESIASTRERIRLLSDGRPDASVIIPAYNEESLILKTLSSLAKTITTRKVEIIVVNNNSTDRTADWARQAGVICVDELQQGITTARNRGLQTAKGRYILNADADTIYPPLWIDFMISPLQRDQVGLVYGNHHFLPSASSSRSSYFFYERGANVMKWVNRKFREEAVNVYGFNSAFRKDDGLLVSGFDHPSGTNEDGWLAVKIRDRLHKRLFYQSKAESMVWTDDRRLLADGGVTKAARKRIERLYR